jgi:Flp pilus assembly protein TadG
MCGSRCGGVSVIRKCQQPRTKLAGVCTHLRTIWAENTGAELFEAALVLPLLLTLLFGIISFGRAYNVYQSMTRAAREGAREIVLTSCATCSTAPYTGSQVRTQFVEPALSADDLYPSKIANYQAQYVWLDPNDSPKYICGIQISFQYPYQLAIPFTSENFSTITLTTKVQMRMENQAGTPGNLSTCGPTL